MTTASAVYVSFPQLEIHHNSWCFLTVLVFIYCVFLLPQCATVMLQTQVTLLFISCIIILIVVSQYLAVKGESVVFSNLLKETSLSNVEILCCQKCAESQCRNGTALFWCCIGGIGSNLWNSWIPSSAYCYISFYCKCTKFKKPNWMGL